MLAGVRRQLLKTGFETNEIPEEWLEIMVAATNKWVSTTSDGIEHVMDLWKHNMVAFKSQRGSGEKDYVIRDNYGAFEQKLDPDGVFIFKGVVSQEDLLLEGNYEFAVEDKRTEQCEDCGAFAHCYRTVRDPGTDVLKIMCNYCTVMNSNPRVQDQGNIHDCGECPMVSCAHHPGKNH
jgi:hypothetical protein